MDGRQSLSLAGVPRYPPVPRSSIDCLPRMCASTWRRFVPWIDHMARHDKRPRRGRSTSSEESARHSDDGCERPPSMPRGREQALFARLNEFQERLEAKEDELKACIQQRAYAMAWVAALQNHGNTVEIRLEVSKQQLSHSQTTNRDLEHQVKTLKSRLESHRCRSEDLLAQHAADTDDLQQQIRRLKEHGQISERNVQIQKTRCAELDAQNTELGAFERADKARISELQESITTLAAQLELAKDHTFLLQGGRRESLLPSAIKADFEDLIESVDGWVTRQVSRLEDDPGYRSILLLLSAANSTTAPSWLQTQVATDPAIRSVSSIPGSDVEGLTSLIWDSLMLWIFSDDGYLSHNTRLRVIRDLESQMLHSCKSSQDTYIISVWRSRAVNAILEDPALQGARAPISDHLSRLLAGNLHALCDHSDPIMIDSFFDSIRKAIIEPALQFRHLMLGERHRYALDFRHFRPGHGGADSSASNEFYQSLTTQDCIILRPGKRVPLKPAKHLVDIPAGELPKHLVKLCALTPSLVTHHISGQNGLGKAETLVNQRTLVLLSPVNSPGPPGQDTACTFLYDLTFPQVDLGPGANSCC